MEKKYLNCQHAGRAQCPNRFHKFMNALLMEIKQDPNKQTRQHTDKVENDANSLCLECQEFSPKHQD